MDEREIYLDLNTFFHRLDPRTKILMLATAFVVILYFEDPLWVLPFSLLVVLHGILSKSIRNMRRIRTLMIILVISTIILWSLFTNGETTLFWIFEVEALRYSAGRALIMLSIVTSGMLFLSTTRTEEFVLGMIRMGLPYRVGFAISTAFRLVPTILGSVVTIGQAQRSRGLDLDSGNIFERFKKFFPLLVPVFVSTIRDTNIFGMALESKGFGAQDERTFYMRSNFAKADYLMLAFCLIVFGIATYLKISGFGVIPGLIKF
jgi:energy-coupling factor transport system permease protein